MLIHSSSSMTYCLSSHGLMISTLGAPLSTVTWEVAVCALPLLSMPTSCSVNKPLPPVCHTASVPLSVQHPPCPIVSHCVGSSPEPTFKRHSRMSPIFALPCTSTAPRTEE